MNDGNGPRPIRTFGRTGGRALSARQQGLIEARLPELAVPMLGAIQPEALFDAVDGITLEIGFGGSEHLIAQAASHPGRGYIGCEPFIEGVAKALTAIDAKGLTNVRLHMDDARPLMALLAPASVDEVFILFPDPWPKKKQRKRRLIQPDFLESLWRICVPGTRVRFATDVASYADEALVTFLADGRYAWQADTADDWRVAPIDHVTTRYEEKRLGDCAPVWFDFLTR